MIWVWVTAFVIVALGVAAVVLLQPGAHQGRHRSPAPRKFRN
jgi:preprotein translocase subunit SecG